MDQIFGASQIEDALEQSRDMFEKFTDTYLSVRSVIGFITAFLVAAILGRIIAAILRKFAHALSRRADKAENLREVNRLRRIETLTILTIALIKMVLFIFALYFWWVFAQPSQQPTALIGASALVIIVAGATIGPILRDLAYGGVMMAEHWFGVGDYVKLEPFGNVEGVVDRVTLRSIRIRGLSGEVIWISNQNIQGVRVSPKGVRTLAIELFVSDLDKGLAMIEDVNLRLPAGPLMVVRPLQIMSKNEVASGLWHITAIGETAPGREWLLEKYALDLMREMDEPRKKKVLRAEPIARYSDRDADRRFARTIQNARKSPLERKRLPSPEELAKKYINQSVAKNHLRQKGRRKIQ
ncbi:MAG TPA: mechanosensitive ion channel family protein [Candidatus Saccharimonadales bacterium]|nr:mechanosensitive ion channel family protein [Candidatus Saccharimonadales bacterium]